MVKNQGKETVETVETWSDPVFVSAFFAFSHAEVFLFVMDEAINDKV